MIKIDKDVPTPTEFAGGRKRVYPFDGMAIGDSFWVDKPSSSLSGSTATAKARTGFKFTARAEEKDGVKGCRIWRTE